MTRGGGKAFVFGDPFATGGGRPYQIWLATSTPQSQGVGVSYGSVGSAGYSGIQKVPITAPYIGAVEDCWFALPTAHTTGRKWPVLYVLPEYAGPLDPLSATGSGIYELVQQDFHNKYGCILVQPHFDQIPWYGDNSGVSTRRHKSFMLNAVLPFFEANYAASTEPSGRLLMGYSKSGWGAFSLVASSPDIFGFAAEWDSPINFTAADYGAYETASAFANSTEFGAACPPVLFPESAAWFREVSRLAMTGYSLFGTDPGGTHPENHMVAFSAQMTALGLPHVYDAARAYVHANGWKNGFPAVCAAYLVTMKNAADAYRSPLYAGTALADPVPANTVAPVVSGDNAIGSTLACSTGTWTGYGAITYSYQWKRDGSNIGAATASTYTLVSGDAGASITCAVTGTNADGNRTATSNALTAADSTAPTVSVAPTITGTFVVNSALTCSTGTWSAGGAITYGYQWYRDGVAIGGETASTHTVVSADCANASITCRVTATYSGHSAYSTSASVAFSPAQIMRSFFRADAGVLAPGGGAAADGGAVDTFTDANGNTSLAAPSAAARPTYHASGFNGGSRPYLTFAANNYLYNAAASWGGTVGGLSFYWIGKSASSASNRYAMNYVSGADQIQLYINGTTNLPSDYIPGSGGGFITGTVTSVDAHLHLSWWDGTTLKHYVGATQDATGGCTHAALADSGAIAFGATTGGAAVLLGDCAEFGWRRTALSSDERTSLNAYATARYGL